jgi:ABC-type spermidine/putrescine transport system permease subunit II
MSGRRHRERHRHQGCPGLLNGRFPAAYIRPIALRTVIYTSVAAALCLLIAYPVAYFVARFAGRRKVLMLVLLIAPSVVQTLRLPVDTTVIAVPLGVAFALGINRWRGVTASSFNFIMILSFVIPELIFAVAMFFTFTALFTFVGLGTFAAKLGLVTWNVSWPAIIMQARLATLGRQYEESSRRPGRYQVADGAQGNAATAGAGHLRQRRPGVLERDRRLRARRLAEL